jgi:prephenate dehydratase
VRIAFQGEPGAYSEAAALRFNPAADVLPCSTFEDVFAAVEGTKTGYGILPIENSIGGSIHRNYDLLVQHELPIVGEVMLHVTHHLLAVPGTRLEQVKRIYSHPQALAQCERYLQGLTGVEIVASYDTAGSAKLVRDQKEPEVAAIASSRAAEVFGLSVLASGIQDFDENITRFLIISRSPTPLGEPDKTSLVFTLHNEPGALFKALSVFALRNIDLTKLESRPIRGRAFEYLFYADISVPRQDLQCARALVHLAEFARSMRTLGSYPAWKEPANQNRADGADGANRADGGDGADG